MDPDAAEASAGATGRGVEDGDGRRGMDSALVRPAVEGS